MINTRRVETSGTEGADRPVGCMPMGLRSPLRRRDRRVVDDMTRAAAGVGPRQVAGTHHRPDDDAPRSHAADSAAADGSTDERADRPDESRPDDAGMSTVEYAVGTVVAAAFAAVLYKIVTGDSVITGLTNLIDTALSSTF